MNEIGGGRKEKRKKNAEREREKGEKIQQIYYGPQRDKYKAMLLIKKTRKRLIFSNGLMKPLQ